MDSKKSVPADLLAVMVKCQSLALQTLDELDREIDNLQEELSYCPKDERLGIKNELRIVVRDRKNLILDIEARATRLEVN